MRSLLTATVVSKVAFSAPKELGTGDVEEPGTRSLELIGVLLRPRFLEPSGDGLEQSDQLVEERLQAVVRSFREGVGQ